MDPRPLFTETASEAILAGSLSHDLCNEVAQGVREEVSVW
jgi:hypothetical protein